VLFTGGAGEDEIHIDNHWVKNANFILQFAINENKKGNPFPIWGTCLGLELLSYLTSRFDENIMQPIEGNQHTLNVLRFQEPSYVYDDLDPDMRQKLTTGPGILYFNHEMGLLESSYRNSKYMVDFWKVTSTTRTFSNPSQTIVSSMEARDYPIFAVQFHPEKNLYEWKVPADRTEYGARISQIMSNKFVEIARKNQNRFADPADLTRRLIYNFKTTPCNFSYLRIYPFKEPRPDDWPYSSTK
jgi:gamma-glutamyl hydrolase